MKIFSWMQSKLNAKQGSRKQNSVSANPHIDLQEPSKEEFSDWPCGLLSIGTFGINNNVKKQVEKCNLHGSEASCQEHLQDIALEEVGELIFDKQVVESSSLDSFEIDRTTSRATYEDIANKGSPPQRSNSSVVLSRGNDSRLDSANNVIAKKSLSFLLKKMFLCSSGFTPTPRPSLRDPLPESRLEKSRMEMILRDILNKKIYPQSSSPKATTAKNYLQNRQFYMTDSEDEMFDEANEGSKWVKTDSEFIVLEI